MILIQKLDDANRFFKILNKENIKRKRGLLFHNKNPMLILVPETVSNNHLVK